MNDANPTTPEHQRMTDELLDYVASEMLAGDARGLDADTPLLEWDVLDSLGMVSMLTFIDQTFGVAIPDDDVLPQNFATIRNVVRLIARHQGRDAGVGIGTTELQRD